MSPLLPGAVAGGEERDDCGEENQAGRFGYGVGDGELGPIGDGCVFAAVDFFGGARNVFVAEDFPAEVVGRVGQPGANVADHRRGADAGHRKSAAEVGADGRGAVGFVEGATEGGPFRARAGIGRDVEAVEPGGIVGGGGGALAGGAGGSLAPILEDAVENHGAIAVLANVFGHESQRGIGDGCAGGDGGEVEVHQAAADLNASGLVGAAGVKGVARTIADVAGGTLVKCVVLIGGESDRVGLRDEGTEGDYRI